ncbi:MAG: Crp/Fnr family transcriptional regulator [Propylenella sp.]
MPTSGSFLRGLEADDRAALEERWSVRHYDRKTMIIAHDEESRDVFFVLEGRARATVYSEGGKAVAFRDIETGGIFGELAAIDGGTRSASVVALDPVRVATLPEAAFRELVTSRPGLAWALLKHLTLQVRHMTERVYEYSTLIVRQRLIRELLRLAERADGQEVPAEISPAPTHFDLASRISTHREAVSREMSALARRGLIEKRGKRLILKRPDKLEELCGEEE